MDVPTDPRLRIRQAEPLNAGPELAALCERSVTPNELFFIRSHGNVPALDPEAYRLTVGGLVERPLTLSLADLRRDFAPVRLAATVECAGNRRSELIAHAPIPGELPWEEDAIGNAAWTGVPLAQVLAAARPLPAARHAAFTGRDETERHGSRFAFGGSIPIAKATSPEVLLAYEMNNAALPAAHGAPLRALVPGFIGARSVKWLVDVHLQEEPSDNYFQAKAYRLFPPQVTAENAVWESGRMLGDLDVNSVICAPRRGDTVAAGAVAVRGYAVAGGGRRVERVELSADGGRTWKAAALEDGEGPWSWRLFAGTLDLPAGEHELVARAWDSAGGTQPAAVAQVWNFKGYMNNAWHRVSVRARPSAAD